MYMRPLTLRLQYLLVALGLAAAMPFQSAQAAQWMDVATISSTMGANPGYVCVGASKTDLGCAIGAPFVTSSGRLGIGTTNPQAPLHVVGVGASTAQITIGNTNNAGFITFRRGSDGAEAGNIGYNSPTESQQFAITGGGGGGYLTFRTNSGPSNERMRITSLGLVGVSTSTPTTALDVNGTLRIAAGGEACDASRTGAIKYESGSFWICQNPVYGWEGLATTGANSLADRITSNSMAGVIANQTGYISLTTGGVTGTVYFTPGGKLIVQGVSSSGLVSATRLVTTEDGTELLPSVALPGDGNGLYMYAPQSIALANNSKRVFSVFADVMEMNMPIYGSDIGSPRINSDTTQINQPGFTFRDHVGIGMGADLDIDMLSLVTSATARVVIDSTGKVGVGKITPQTLFDISGTLRIANGGEACDANRLGAIRYTSNNFQICRNGTTWETLVAGNSGTMDTDRITSSTTAAVIANQTGGTVSFTLGGTASAAYMHPTLGLVTPGVSATGTVSGVIVATPLMRLIGVSGSAGVSMTQAGDNLGNHTATQDLDMATNNITNAGSITASGNIKTTAALQAGNTDTTCAGAADYGKMRFDSASKMLFLCRP